MNRAFLTLAMVLALLARGAAQSKPDHSGTWTMDEARSVSAVADGFTGPVTWVIRQTAQELTMEITRGSRTQTQTYILLDEAPAGPFTPSTAGEPSHRAYWDGDKLVAETAQNINGQTVTTREIRTLQPRVREMTVEKVVRIEHGYSLKGTDNYSTAKDLFRKVSP